MDKNSVGKLNSISEAYGLRVLDNSGGTAVSAGAQNTDTAVAIPGSSAEYNNIIYNI